VGLKREPFQTRQSLCRICLAAQTERRPGTAVQRQPKLCSIGCWAWQPVEEFFYG